MPSQNTRSGTRSSVETPGERFYVAFPYAMYFRVYDEVVVVVACMHGRRNPRRWQVRT